MAKIEIDVEKILKQLGEGDNPAYSLKTVKEVANKVEYIFRKDGFGIIEASNNSTGTTTVIDTKSSSTIVNDTEELQSYVPKFKNSKPSYLKKGDLFLGYSVNGKGRPMVVAKVLGDIAYCIALTTTEDEYTLIPHNSRFLEAGFYSNSFVVAKITQVTRSFIGIIDDTRTLNKAIKLIKEKIKKDLL